MVGDVSLSLHVDSKAFPTTASLAPVTVQLTDVYGVGVTGRASGIQVYAHRVVEQTDIIASTLAFADQWQSLSYLERLQQLFSLMVQVSLVWPLSCVHVALVLMNCDCVVVRAGGDYRSYLTRPRTSLSDLALLAKV